MSQLKIRYSVRELQQEFDSGNKQPLKDLVRAWKGITELAPDDLNSFFVIGGYHGEPFADQGATDPAWWGGYCNHGNVLFPTWHRIYVWRLEQALQSIVPGVMMPYWDETSEQSMTLGIPSVLTQTTFQLDGELIDNPLRSYTLQKAANDDVKNDDQVYTKPKGYKTVRYPLSGLVGTAEARQETEKHNAAFSDPEQNISLLNDNVIAWLHGKSVTDTNPHPTKQGIYWQFLTCLDAPNYTAFSNTTSAAAWNKSNSGLVVTLESPHNDIHLAVGGYDVASAESGQIDGANGDMGENNTAGLDPIFFFHHCNVDRMFWLWQVKNGHQDSFEIIAGDPGANSNTLSLGGQGPAAGQQMDQELAMDSPLYPFLKDPADPNSHYVSTDCINIERQLGITYSQGSLAPGMEITAVEGLAAGEKTAGKKLKVSGINRNLFKGSFIVQAYVTIDGERALLGSNSVLSRWNVENCENCQAHLVVDSFFDLSGLSGDEFSKATFDVEIRHRGDKLPQALSYTCEVVD